ncbi:MAG: RNA polymerase sigma factor [Oscillospiraceae bacterium]|jgi:RNA polymerase sigma-70 factor (ECF subfamily)|nr:RNA polymerase sigma factor [Oscillospiraceae bacterium]
MSKDIQALLSRLAGGDMDALGALYDTLSVRVFNYARTIARSREMAEDITHDVFLQIHKQAAKLAKMSNPEAYIMVTARHHAYNLLKRGRQENVPLDDAREAEGPSSAYGRLLFDDAFSRLPANQRETVYLHLICGYPHKEVARLQNAPVVTVKWRYGKALAQLRAYFSQDEKEEHYNECL